MSPEHARLSTPDIRNDKQDVEPKAYSVDDATEQEYFRNLSNRLLGGLVSTVTTYPLSGIIGISICNEFGKNYLNPSVSFDSPLLLGIFMGFSMGVAAQARDIWKIRHERVSVPEVKDRQN